MTKRAFRMHQTFPNVAENLKLDIDDSIQVERVNTAARASEIADFVVYIPHDELSQILPFTRRQGQTSVCCVVF